MENKIIQGDCLIQLKELESNSVDSIVTDPPYELGFMGKSWDNTGIANNSKMWAECLRVLKPGGYLLSFSGTRTYHRMASAIEDAGFEVRDMIEWLYGSGFPKSLNIGKAVDKLQGNDRGNWGLKPNEDVVVDKGTSEYEGWGTALKPSHEPICMARKPLSEKTVAENCLKWGTGGINIDESRISHDEDVKITKRSGREDALVMSNDSCGFNNTKNNIASASPAGRFPANLIHDNSEEVRECFPNESERFFKSIIYQAKASKSERNKGCEGLENEKFTAGNYSQSPVCKSCDKTLNGTNDHIKCSGEVYYRKMKSKATSNNHPTVKPIALMEYLIKMVTPKGGIVLDPFAGSGSTLVSAKKNGFQYIGIEMSEEYIPIIEARLSSLSTGLR